MKNNIHDLPSMLSLYAVRVQNAWKRQMNISCQCGSTDDPSVPLWIGASSLQGLWSLRIRILHVTVLLPAQQWRYCAWNRPRPLPKL